MAGQPPLPLDCGPEWTAVRGEMKRYEQLAEQIAELIRSGVLAWVLEREPLGRSPAPVSFEVINLRDGSERLEAGSTFIAPGGR